MNPPARIYKTNVFEEIESNALVADFSNELNSRYWNVVERGDNCNNELQYYSPKNVNIRNGFLDIEARKEIINGHQYTSGLIDTKNKYEFLYGKIIFRTKPAIGNGLVSAIWLLPADDDYLPEVDIVESLGTQNNQMWTGVHYLDPSSKQLSNFTNYPSNKDFSTYELDWEENEIRFYVDNNLTYKTNVGVPNEKMYLIINLSVGGDWPRNPDDSILPTSFLIDYIMIIPKELDIS
jgi:beta-glucanase (GH16 family)